MAKLILMCGYPYSGKTVLAKEIAQHFGYERIDIDDVLLQHGYKSFDDPRITPEELSQFFDECYDNLRSFLKSGKSVIFDTSNPSFDRRQDLANMALQCKASSMVIYLDLPKELILERWRNNIRSQERMQITERTLEEAFLEMEKPSESENVLFFDGSLKNAEWIEKYKDTLQD
jgi:predicted kinase